MAPTLKSLKKKAREFFYRDKIQDGNIINAMELACLYSAIRMGALLYRKSQSEFWGQMSSMSIVGMLSDPAKLSPAYAAYEKWVETEEDRAATKDDVYTKEDVARLLRILSPAYLVGSKLHRSKKRKAKEKSE